MIGRDLAAFVSLQHPAIAQKHALLEFGPLGRWWPAFDTLSDLEVAKIAAGSSLVQIEGRQ